MKALTTALLLCMFTGCVVNEYVGPAPATNLPATLEAQACGRECEQTYQTCRTACAAAHPSQAMITFRVGHCSDDCGDTWQHCLTTCPGATPAQPAH